MRGVVAAGHPLSAEAGADVLRAGGNAVDAAIAAMLASFTTEPLLTGFGAGGYMLVGTPQGEDVLIDFFVEAHGRATAPGAAELIPVVIAFGDVEQVFNVGPASAGAYGNPAGICAAHERFATLPLAELAAPAIGLARRGVPLNDAQAAIFELLEPIIAISPEARERFAMTRPGDVVVLPELADAIEHLAAEGAAPFYTGDVAARVCDWVGERGGSLSRENLAGYRVVERDPVVAAYRGRHVLTNPPPSAGGLLIAYVLGELDRKPGPPTIDRIVAAMQAAQEARTPAFLEGLDRPGFLDEFLAARLGNTTHLSVIDADGMACSVTCTNGEGSGVVVPGTGVHLNNMMGESDLSPMGFFTHPAGRRLPSMMAPTLVRSLEGKTELVLGSAGSNRIRSTILQVVSNVIDRGMTVSAAVQAPRVHWEDGVVYAEPGADLAGLEPAHGPVAAFQDLNVFFGGCQAVHRDPATGELSGAGDPRRGGAVVMV